MPATIPKEIVLRTARGFFPPIAKTEIQNEIWSHDQIQARPTTEYLVFQAAFDHFNREIFNVELPQVMLTMQRGRYLGYFSWDRFTSRAGQNTVHEIAVNPKHFGEVSDEDILSTFVHEMVHLWQQEFGIPSGGGYHNREWAAKMREIGLLPSSTGEEGGKETGFRMTHCIIEGGMFQLSAQRFLVCNWLSWQDASSRRFGHRTVKPADLDKKRLSKTKFTCPHCAQNAWANHTARLICGVCHEQMVPDTQSRQSRAL